jgi:hypothetical protein
MDSIPGIIFGGLEVGRARPNVDTSLRPKQQ